MTNLDLAVADLNKPHWGNYDTNVRFLSETGLLNSPLKILEIGCGKGDMVRYLLEWGHDVTGIDLDSTVIQECRKENGELPILVAPGDVLPFVDNSFDLVLSFDVFEHIRDSDLHLREVSRVLKVGGFYLLQTPNKWANMLFEPIRFTRKFGIKNAFRFLEDHCALHNYWQLIRRFKRHGFEAKFFDIPVVNEWFKLKVERFLGKAGLLALKLVNPDKLPLPLRTNFYVQARKMINT